MHCRDSAGGRHGAPWAPGTSAAAEVWSLADLPRLQPLLPRAPRVELEVGSGSGAFLAACSAARRDTLVIGTEIKLERCRKAARKLARAEADNGVIIRARAEEVIARLAPGSLAAVHIYFPDPWPKRRHRRRRLLRKGVIEDLARLLRPGGCLYLATDFFDYYLQAVVLLLLHPELEVDRDPARVPAYADAELSRYGPRLAALGKSIHYATARRRR
jgi:tRNA (guanine-N7-)-methyltransferase